MSKLRCWDGTIASALRLILKVKQGGIARGDGRNAANRSATDSLFHLGDCARRASYWEHTDAARSPRARPRQQRYGRLPGCASLGLDAGYVSAIANQGSHGGEHANEAAHGDIGTPNRDPSAPDSHPGQRHIDCSIITNCHSSD